VQLLLKNEVEEVEEVKEKRPVRSPAFSFPAGLGKTEDQREAAR
jgi:hypothetical protein